MVGITALKMMGDAYSNLDFNFDSEYLLRRGMVNSSTLWKYSFVIHPASGPVGWLLGLSQFLPVIRQGYPLFHRYAGRIYVAAVVICAISGSYSSISGIGGLGFKFGVQVTYFSWLWITLWAVYQIRLGNKLAHQRWMIRSYFIGFVIFTYRIIYVLLKSLFGLEYDDAFTLSGIAILVNLFIAEVIILFQSRAARLSSSNKVMHQ